MTENGDPLENVMAERINGIVKGEYLDCFQVNSIQGANELLSQVVNLYNQVRPHMSIGNKTHEEIHQINQKNRSIVEKLLSQKPYTCKPIKGLTEIVSQYQI